MSRKSRKHSKAQATIQASLEIAKELAQAIEAMKRNDTDHEPANVPAPPVTK